MIRFLALVVALVLACDASEAANWKHRRLVLQSGIAPANLGTHEGVGMSSRSYQDAVQKACYWGKLKPVSIQYSQRNGLYYAVVRYQ